MSNPEVLGFLSEVELDASTLNSLDRDMANAVPAKADTVSGYVLEKYGVDLSGRYVSLEIPHPFGKAAGQLSLHERHVSGDRESGLAFTVLKSAVGVTESGQVGIDAWQKSAPKMVAEKRESRDGRDGWTITWKGRGWAKGFDAYVELYANSLNENPGYPVIPSLMVDVTNPDRAVEQGEYCIGKLIDVHDNAGSDSEFLIEIDISPTMLLLPDSGDEESVREWVRKSVVAFRHGLAERGKSIVKLPNADRGPEFQAELVKTALDEGKGSVGGLIVGNRLFDPNATFEGQTGIAYGGYDLSNANLDTLDRMIEDGIRTSLIGTGNICSGRIMVEYAVRGCDSGQLHTFFQLPSNAYRAPKGHGGKIWRAMRELLFHPDDGLVATLFQLETSGKLDRKDGVLRFRDLPTVYTRI